MTKGVSTSYICPVDRPQAGVINTIAAGNSPLSTFRLGSIRNRSIRFVKLRTVINNPSKTFSTMTRVHLAQLLRDLASAHDYAFFSAPDEYMPSEIDRYPAA